MKKEEKQQIRAHIAELTQQLVPAVQALIDSGESVLDIWTAAIRIAAKVGVEYEKLNGIKKFQREINVVVYTNIATRNYLKYNNK